jgi:hypothetical protein
MVCSVFQIGQPTARVDVLQHIDGISFDKARGNRIEGLIDGEFEPALVSSMLP